MTNGNPTTPKDPALAAELEAAATGVEQTDPLAKGADGRRVVAGLIHRERAPAITAAREAVTAEPAQPEIPEAGLVVEVAERPPVRGLTPRNGQALRGGGVGGGSIDIPSR